MAPFKLWVHTHPGFDAYWSGTDRLSLANAGPMIETALVLGSTGVKRSLNMALLGLIGEPLGEDGSLRNWLMKTALLGTLGMNQGCQKKCWRRYFDWNKKTKG